MNTTQFIHQLSKLRPNATFLTIKGYGNEYGEIADYSLIFHIDYSAALNRSVDILEKIPLVAASLEDDARKELITSFRKSLQEPETMENRSDPTYQFFVDSNNKPIKGIKSHWKTGVLHLYGLENWKNVRMPGIYPKVQHRELTVAKNKLKSLTPLGKFRQFKMLPSQVESISCEKIVLLPPNS